MTQSSTDSSLVERLLGYAESGFATDHKTDCADAASRISTLVRELEEARLAASVIEGISNELDIALTAAEAKVARMEAALKPFAFEGMRLERTLYVSPRITPTAIERARSALDREGEDGR